MGISRWIYETFLKNYNMSTSMAHWKVERLELQKWTHKILNILKEKVTKIEETQVTTLATYSNTPKSNVS